MPQAVSNSSPLIHLSAIGRLCLLNHFSSLFIPPAVWHEVVEEGGTRPGATEIRRARDSGWVSVKEPVNTDLVHLLEQDLHAGEAESIVLALKTKPDILLLYVRRKPAVSQDYIPFRSRELLAFLCRRKKVAGLLHCKRK